MGGGDLNLKKSWHPNTMKNQERVWKAEQKDSDEKKRIAELQREINAERSKEDLQKHGEDSGTLKKKDDVKLEWMYKGPNQTVNHEDYLLGKAIDKNFEKTQHEKKSMASTSFEGCSSGRVDVQVDMARKVLEDPLEAIKRRAFEKAKELYNNPVKMKKIKMMAASQSKSSSKKHKKDKKKKKKKKKDNKSKSHKKSGSDSDEDKDLDALLTAKLRKVLKDRDILEKLKREADSGSSDSDSSEKPKKSAHKRSEMSKEQPQNSQKTTRGCPSESSRKRSRSRSAERFRKSDHSQSWKRCSPENVSRVWKEKNNYSSHNNYRSHTSNEKERKQIHQSSSLETKTYNRNDDSDDENASNRKRTFGLMMADGSKPVAKPSSLRPEYKSDMETKKPPQWQRKERVKLSEEEMERKRQEMLANASWRDKEREATVKQYRHEEAKEKHQHEKDFDENFAMKQFSKATEQASIEGRIKSKLNTIQRSKVSMDKNFARR